ncbi:MAG: PCYCGC motif-containing (lipo)protein [Dehalococcoidia bacterium]|nr:PCYCGC motif-containing (lipo)protein [Dehalococcoidia bacterium]
MKLKSMLLGALALALLAVACSGPAQEQEGLPSFAYNSKNSLEGYKFAAANQALVSQIPCYCGCANLPGGQAHKSLKNCYLKDSGAFDDHASACDLCNSIALDVKAWQGQGVAVKDIRTRIDDKYAGYGQPTDTPPVP